MKISKTRRILLSSFIAILFSLLTFTFTTFAWFSDRVSSSDNIITVGNLDAEMYWTDNLNSGKWYNIENPGHNTVFSHDNYEPGYSEVRYIKIVNAGSLAFEYDLSLLPVGEIGKLAEVVDVYYLSNVSNNISSNELSSMNKQGTIKNTLGKSLSGVQCLLPEGSNDVIYHEHEIVVAIGLKMQTTAGNEYQGQSIGDGFSIKLVATQYDYEKDSFGSDYDTDATFPASVSVGVSTTNNKVNKAASIRSDLVEIFIPEGVEVNAGISALTLTVNEMDETGSNITLEGDEVSTSLDVHIDGVSENNTVPMIISISNVASKYLNKGNIELFHVEDGQTIQMTEVNSKNDLTKHNQFYYDSASGTFMVALASFSEVVAVENKLKAWEGKIDLSWYTANPNADIFTIYNADQLAGFGQIVGGMAEGIVERKTFSGKEIKLIADINLGDKDNANEDIIFHPIGYYYTDDKNADGTTGDYYSTVYSFEGVFNGNGHKISNFYQNTWEIKGDYDGNYYSDAMGLFGYVYGGTVKNLAIENFSCDGEFTPTGVVAAFAAHKIADDEKVVKTTFENIAIRNCNPRVYNTGNGGIIGIAGNTSDTSKGAAADFAAIKLKNITVDNSNKISALWGSWDVACGGLVGMYRGKGGIHFEDCHVSAIIDVNNDVCANYQYYAYRYAGMIIGSVRENKTINGKVYPNMDGIFATECTVHYSTWNNYFYCELVENTKASYTHDYQMSRLTEIKDISEIKVNNKWTKTGDFVLVTYKTDEDGNIVIDENGEETVISSQCYHIRKNSDGGFYERSHDSSGYEDGIDENKDGQDDLKEDKQCVYLPFAQLVTGYSWGVTSKGIDEVDGVSLMDKELIGSIEKFESLSNIVSNTDIADRTIKLGDLFKASKLSLEDSKYNIRQNNIQVGVTYVDAHVAKDIDVSLAKTNEAWTEWTITLAEDGENLVAGMIYVTIQDYVYCTPTTVKINLVSENKFVTKFTNDFIYRVGNHNPVELGSLFKVIDNKIDVHTVDVDIKGNASGTYTANAGDWKKGTIQFSGTGMVTITICDCCSNTEVLKLEVVDAVNATQATSATKNNVVLLNDCGFSSLEVSGGYTLYGNGFTMTCDSDSAALDTGYAFVTLNNGTLDNVQIDTPKFDYAVLYKSNMTEAGNRSETTDKTRYFNVKSGVMVSGNSQILNSRISGARAAVNVTGGNVLIENSRIEGGAVASLLVGSANSVILRDVTLVQKPTASTYDPSKTLMGFSTLFICDADGNAAPVTLEGTLVQNAWVDENDKQYVPSAGQSIISTVLGKTDYLHDIDGDDTKESLNLGFAYMPESLTSKVNTATITDNRTNKDDVPYDYVEVSILSGKTYVYSYKSQIDNIDIDTEKSFIDTESYIPNKQGDIITVSYSDTADGLTTGKSFGTNGWVYELNVDLDRASGYKLDFSKLSMTVNGTNVTDYKVNGSAKPTAPVAVTAGGTTYELTATIDGKEYKVIYKVTGTETSKESPSKISGPTTAGFGVAKSYGGDWSGAADVLTGVKVKYWSVAENKYIEFDFSNFMVPGNAGKLNSTNNYWEYTHTNNDFTLKVTNTVAIHSGKSVYGMPIRGTDGKLYFTISSTNGYVGSGTTSRSITMQYEFTDNNGGEKLTFTHTFSINYSKDEQYSYSDLSGKGKLTPLTGSTGGSGSDGCVTPESLITLADGSQVRVDSLVGNEQLLVWNLETGKLDSAPIMFIDNDPESSYKVVNLHFSDDTIVKVIYEHGFWDYNLGKYVYLDENASEYIGHWFAKQNGDTLEKVQLVNVVIEEEMTSAWSPVTVGHLCYFVNGMLSMPGGVEGLFNIFDVNPETMTYDYEAMQRDIETYGLYTYEEVNALAPLSREMFEQCGGAYLKVSIAKGNMTEEDLIYMIERYKNFYTSLVALGLIL